MILSNRSSLQLMRVGAGSSSLSNGKKLGSVWKEIRGLSSKEKKIAEGVIGQFILFALIFPIHNILLGK